MMPHRLATFYLAAAMLLAPIAHAQPSPLQTFLQSHLKSPFGSSYPATSYVSAVTSLTNSSTPQTIVYLTGPHWCGAVGCTLLVLTSTGSTYHLVSKTLGVQLPISTLPSHTNGWHDLAVASIEGPKRLPFNGRRYPINAYCFPSRRLAGPPTGDVVIPSSAKALPLIP